ncbi:hypothetical protein DYB32_008925, partial [Aphanomyces invadans]
SLGSTILGVIYLTFTLSAFMGPLIPSLHWAIMIPAAFMEGVGASVLWIAQATYLTELSVLYAKFKHEPVVSSMGVFNGVFYSIFRMSAISGNIISSLVPAESLFVMYTIIGMFGAALMLALPALTKPTGNTEFAKLVPSSDPARSPTDGESSSRGGFSFQALWAVATDKYGPLSGQLVGFAAMLVAFSLCYWVPVAKCDGQWALVVVVGVLLSLGDACTIVLGQEFPSDAVSVFSIFKVFQSGSAAASYFGFRYLRYDPTCHGTEGDPRQFSWIQFQWPGAGICQAGDVCQDKVKFTCDDACAPPFTECECIMLSAAVLLGLSASVLWISQASYLTDLSVVYATIKGEPVISSMGHFNGLFYGIFNMSGITGNLISSLVLDWLQWPKTTLFLIYTCLGLSGTALFILLPTLPKKHATHPDEGASLNGVRPPVFSAAKLWTLAKDRYSTADASVHQQKSLYV